MSHFFQLKFIYSEKATNFWEISTLDLSYIVTVKSTVEISQNFVPFSEYMKFKCKLLRLHRSILITKGPTKFLESHLNLIKFRFSGNATKIWTNLPQSFGHQTFRKMAPSFCGLLRMYQLYTPTILRDIHQLYTPTILRDIL